MKHAIEIEHLRHVYGRRTIYEDLNFRVPKGAVFGLLGKNGVGKTTLIKILMGFLRPTAGSCRILGDPSHSLSPRTRAKVGLLFEGHLAYDFLDIAGIERFFAPFYDNWKPELYYALVEKLGLPMTHKISNMSEGQRSQIVLGLIMAQQPEVLILDDYTMGLDAGYRRLFLEYLADYLKNGDKTVLVTSHIVQDLEQFVDDIIFLERGGMATQLPLKQFLSDFRQYRLPKNGGTAPTKNSLIKNVEETSDGYLLYSFSESPELAQELQRQGVHCPDLDETPMSFEDAFVGFTGRY